MVRSGWSLMREISVYIGKIRFRAAHAAGVYRLCDVGAIVPHRRPRRHSNNGICCVRAMADTRDKPRARFPAIEEPDRLTRFPCSSAWFPVPWPSGPKPDEPDMV